VLVCGQMDSTRRIFIKKCFLFVVGSVCCIKQITIGWQTFHWWQRGWNGSAKVAETTVKRLICCWFWRTGKGMGQCWRRLCWEINVFPSMNITFMFYIHLWPIYWLSLILLLFYDWGSRADTSTALLSSGHKGGLSHPLGTPEEICILSPDFRHEWGHI
jgi:hypothetical protein